MTINLNNVKNFDVRTMKSVLRRSPSTDLAQLNAQLLVEHDRLSEKLRDYNDEMRVGVKSDGCGALERFAFRKNTVNVAEFQQIMSGLKKVEWLMTVVWEVVNIA